MKAETNPLVKAISGPIMLITLGSVLALDHFGGYGISRTWPVLLIAMGLLKFFERMTSGPTQGGQL